MKSQWLILLLLNAYVHTDAQMITNRDSLKQVIATTKEDTAKINALWNLGFSYAFVHQDSAVLFANEGLELSKKIAYTSGEANNNKVLCMALTLQGNYTSALQYGFNYLAIGEKLRDSEIIMLANDALAICYREQEDYSEALKYVYKAEALCRKLGAKTEHWPFVLGNLSIIHERLNNLDSALYYGLKSYSLIKYWSGIYLKLGTVYTKLNKPDSALYYYRAGVPYAKEYFIYIDLVDIYSNMSELFQSTGNLDSAVYYGNKSVTQEGILSYSEGRIRAVTHLAKLYESLGQKDNTLKYYKLSLLLNEKLFDREKIREAQSLAFNEKLHQQELKAQKIKEENRFKMYGFLGLSVIFLVIVFFLWRNNRQKQKAKLKIETAYNELEATQALLIQSEKMASLGELTAGIAHEIQNPLNFVNNFSEVNKELLTEMNEEIEKGNFREVSTIARDITENEEKIHHHGKRADAIVKGMLQHSRASSGKKEPTDINALVDEYLRLAYHGYRAKDKSFNVQFETDFDPSLPKINLIPQDIGRVLLNLINNAFYACNERVNGKRQTANGPSTSSGTGNQTALTGPVAEPVEAKVSVTTKNLGDKIEIRVKDNGNGIPPDIVPKIFQPFFSTKPTGQGAGLGLSLSYDIVKAHGGELKVETREGEGSEFTILLPIV